MNFEHKELANGKWTQLSLIAQMANIGSEVERFISWKEKSNPQYSEKAFRRALELLYLTIEDRKNRKRLKELTRVREALIGCFIGAEEYNNMEEYWRKYFLQFAYAARKKI